MDYTNRVALAPSRTASSRSRRRPFAEVPDDARPYAVRMRDGIRLATDVYLPRRGRRWPVLLSRLPYDKAGDECFMPDIARWFTARGYAVVVQDVRGKLRSDGPLAPFRAEIVDGYDTLDWITAQSWYGGPVGMFGDSYFGWTQWAAAASGHPALAAIAPRVISADFGRLTSSQGVFAMEMCALWAFETWVDEALYDYDGMLDWSVRPLAEVVPAALGGRRSRFLDEVGAGRLDPAARLPVRGDIPALHVGGWWDIAQRGQLATYQAARASNRAPQFLVMDATDHGWTALREPDVPYTDPRTDTRTLARFLDAYLNPVEEFLHHFLCDGGTYAAPPVRWALAHDGWRTATAWPPPGSRPMTWYPAGDGPRGGLATAPDHGERTVRWTHDPAGPVPSRAHAYHPLIEPADQSPDEKRDDVLGYDSEPFRTPCDLAGPVEVRLWLAADAPSAHIMARISDVAPDGTALKILDGAAYATGPWPAEVTIDLGGAGYRLRPGHRLRLDLSASEFPRYPPHPGTGENPWLAHDFRRTEQWVILGGTRAARLCCRVVSDGGDV